MEYEFILRILVAALLGGLIGLEREYRAKEAGFRTHFLVALGSALFMIVSAYGFGDVQMVGWSLGHCRHRSGLWRRHVRAFHSQYVAGTLRIGSLQLLPSQVRQAPQRVTQ